MGCEGTNTLVVFKTIFNWKLVSLGLLLIALLGALLQVVQREESLDSIYLRRPFIVNNLHGNGERSNLECGIRLIIGALFMAVVVFFMNWVQVCCSCKRSVLHSKTLAGMCVVSSLFLMSVLIVTASATIDEESVEKSLYSLKYRNPYYYNVIAEEYECYNPEDCSRQVVDCGNRMLQLSANVLGYYFGWTVIATLLSFLFAARQARRQAQVDPVAIVVSVPVNNPIQPTTDKEQLVMPEKY